MISEAVSSDLELAWRQFAGDLRRFIVRRVATPEDADDILQLVFLRLASNAGTLADVHVAAWLYATTRNAVTDYYRSAARRREFPVDALPGVKPSVDDPDDNDAERELGRCLLPMIDRLPADQAQAIRMVDLDGATQTDAAAKVQVSVSGMKSRVQRGRMRLREMLAQCCEVHRDARGRVFDFDGCEPNAVSDTAVSPGCAAC